MSKYHSKQAICNEMHKHASQKEAHRCDELNILQKQKIIKNLQQQPEFPLRDKFKFQGETIRAITYRADFSYFDNEKKKFVIEDTKGFRTAIYKLKIKLLKYILRDTDDFIFLES
jgi:hypothetical protein